MKAKQKASQEYLKFGHEEDIGKTMSPAKTWFDRSTQLTALRPSKGELSTLRKIEGQRREVQRIRKIFLTLRLGALAG